MKYYKFTAETPYCGTDYEEYRAFKDEPTEEELSEIADEICADNAASFEYLISGWDEEPTEEEKEDYYADCCCTWVEVTEEKYLKNN